MEPTEVAFLKLARKFLESRGRLNEMSMTKPKPKASKPKAVPNKSMGPIPGPQAQRGRNAPVAIGNRRAPRGDMTNGLRIRRREYIGDIKGSADSDEKAISIVRFAPSEFPWCSRYDSIFESFRFEALAFEYIPTCASSKSGYVILSPDFDAGDAGATANTPKEVLLNAKNAVATQSWDNVRCRLDRADLNKRKSYYTGGTATIGNSNARQRYAGFLNIAAGGQGDADTIGEIWAEYDIVLETPQLLSLDGPPDGAASYTGSSNTAPFGLAISTGSVPLTFESSGTTTSVTTFTATKAFNGYMSLDVSGADINLVVSGTGEESTKFAYDNNTRLTGLYYLQLEQNETFVVTITNTSISALTAYFIRGADV